MRGLAILVPAVFLFSIVPGHARAEDAEVTELQVEVEILRREVKALHARIETLEGKREGAAARAPTSEPVVARTNAPPPTGKTDNMRTDSIVALKLRWSKVAPGMTGPEVTETIGEPAAKLAIDGRPVWYYIYAGIGRGSVMFDGGGRVSSLQAPAVGWSW
jgi:hypothetical protein